MDPFESGTSEALPEDDDPFGAAYEMANQENAAPAPTLDLSQKDLTVGFPGRRHPFGPFGHRHRAHGAHPDAPGVEASPPEVGAPVLRRE